MPPLAPTRLGLLLALALCPASVTAAPPVLTNLTPRGAERGKPVEVVVAGANLTPAAKLLLPFPATQTLLPDAKPNPAQLRFQLTVDPSVPLGVYPVRLLDDGVSAFALFSVDAFPNVNEVEDNNSFDKAQGVPVPCAVTGQCAGGDVDFFRFAAKKGQRLVIETEAARLGSGVVPQLRVTDGRRRFVAADDRQAVQGDCRILLDVPADGDYVVEVSDSRYRGGNPPHYRLKVGEYDVTEEVFPLGGRRGDAVEFTLRGGTLPGEVRVRRTLDDATQRGDMLLRLDGVLRPGMLSPRLAVGDLPERVWLKAAGPDPRALDVLPPVTINSRLERPGDADRFQFAVQPGQRFRVAVQAQALGSNLDGVLRISDQAGKQLALVDDVDLPPAPGQAPVKSADPSADVVVPAGVSLLAVELRDQRGRGGVNFGYRLTVEPTVPDFAVQQPAAEANVPRGGTAALLVPVVRRGYAGPVELTVPDLPSGLTVQGGHVPANGVVGLLTLTAAAQAAAPLPAWLRIEGRATSEGRELRRTAEQRLTLSRDAGADSAVLTLPQFALGLTAAEPFTVQGPATVEVVRGYAVPVPVTITRAADQPALAVEVTGILSPPGQPPAAAALTFQPATAAAGAGAASFTVTATAAAPEGKALDLLVQGKSKVGNADKIVIGPALTVTVVRPFTVELLTPSVTLPAGQTVAVKGRLRRHPVFKEAVQVKLDGLPAGVTLAAPPKPVDGDWTEFLIDLKVDPKATTASANLTLTASATIAGAAYAAPPVTVPAQVTAAK